MVDLPPSAGDSGNYSFFTIVPDGFVLRGEQLTYYGYCNVTESPRTDFPMVVDSGTTLMYLPRDVAAAVNAAYQPPSVHNKHRDVYENLCDAVPPTFAIRIGGTDFYIRGEDLLMTEATMRDPENGLCVTGVKPTDDVSILGDVFLKNVVAVFDVGARETRFAAHDY